MQQGITPEPFCKAGVAASGEKEIGVQEYSGSDADGVFDGRCNIGRRNKCFDCPGYHQQWCTPQEQLNRFLRGCLQRVPAREEAGVEQRIADEQAASARHGDLNSRTPWPMTNSHSGPAWP